MALISACHSVGWPVAAGGSRSIADALAAVLLEHGGKIETGVRVRSLSELEAPGVVVFDLAPGAVADIVGDRLPRRVERAYRRYRHGPAAFKVDLAVEGGVPWANEACRTRGHRPRDRLLRGDGRRRARRQPRPDAGAPVRPGRPAVPRRPPALRRTTSTRSGPTPTCPSGYDGDGEKAVVDQLERFAPGLRERIVATSVRSPAELAAYNPNYVGGDIVTGANTPIQIAIRPRLALDPYSTGVPGLFICSAATPPGGGRPRHGRLQRREVGAPAPGPELIPHAVPGARSPGSLSYREPGRSRRSPRSPRHWPACRPPRSWRRRPARRAR